MTGFRATYRLQLGGDFGFAAARELVPYLADLGVSHLYLPPSFQARPGSTHGYDVVDPTSISEELGGEAEFRALIAAAREAGLGVILDIVPNHMAVDDANRYWTEQRSKFFDVDEETGKYRRFFDIDHLAGVRQEDPEVFEETHRLAIALISDGAIDGLRIDHPDGLADPQGYLERLRDAGVEHVWVEKILDPGERLRTSWPVEGTVGYEFLNDVAALFIDPCRRRPPHRRSGTTSPATRGRSPTTPPRPSWSRHPPRSPRRWNASRAASRATTCPRPSPHCRSTARTSATATPPPRIGRCSPRPASSGCSTRRPSSSPASSRPRRR